MRLLKSNLEIWIPAGVLLCILTYLLSTTLIPVWLGHTGTLEDKAASIQDGMTAEQVEHVLGPSKDQFPPVPFQVGTPTIDPPDLPKGVQRFWDHPNGVIEMWFADNKVIFRRYWTRAPAGMDEAIRALRTKRSLGFLRAGRVYDAIRELRRPVAEGL